MDEPVNPSDSPLEASPPDTSPLSRGQLDTPLSAAAGVPHASRRRRRWYQFTLGALMVLVLVAAAVLTAWRIYIAPYQAQAETIQLIQRLGGTYKAESGPAWMSRLAGFDVRDITLVNLADCDTPDEYIEQVARLPRLQTLVVGGSAVTDQHAAKLATLKALRWLVVDSTRATDAGLAALQQALPQLTTYRSDRRAIAEINQLVGYPLFGSDEAEVDPELQQLAGPEFFQEIVIVDVREDAHVPLLAKLSKVTIVDLSYGKITDTALAHVAALKGVKDVRISFAPAITDAGLMKLAALTDLEVLKLNDVRVTDAGLACLPDLKRLTFLELRKTDVTDAGLARLAGLCELETVWLSSTKITDAGLVHLAGLHKLRHLDLSDTKVKGTGLVHISQLRNLAVLGLNGTRTSDDGLAHLGELTNLVELQLSKTNVTDGGLVHLAGLTNLIAIHLESTRVSDAGLVHLTKLKNLTHLLVANSQVTDAGVAKALSHLTGQP